MRPIGEWAHLMPVTVQIAAKSSDDRYGKPTYGAAVSYTAHLSRMKRMVTNGQGQVVASEQAIYLNGSPPVLPTAQVTLSTADAGSTESWALHPPVMAVERRYDQSGPHHTVVHLG